MTAPFHGVEIRVRGPNEIDSRSLLSIHGELQHQPLENVRRVRRDHVKDAEASMQAAAEALAKVPPIARKVTAGR
jgi:hypothetical protein